MKPEDYDRFCEIILGFAELRGRELSPPAIELYWRAMQDWELAEFSAAAEHLLRTCEWMPTPFQFEQLRRAGRMTAGEAWDRVLEVTRTGRYRECGSGSVVSPFVDRVVRDIGGYRSIAMCETDKLQFREHRFVDHYRELEHAEHVRGGVPQIARAEWPRLSSRPSDALASPHSAKAQADSAEISPTVAVPQRPPVASGAVGALVRSPVPTQDTEADRLARLRKAFGTPLDVGDEKLARMFSLSLDQVAAERQRAQERAA